MNLDSNCTVEYQRQLAPYTILKSGHHVDKFVEEIASKHLPQDTLDSLDKYTRGMYTEELHYKSFLKYARSLSEEHANARSCKNDPCFQKAIVQVRLDLACLDNTKPIPVDKFADVVYIPSSSAGYGYVGKKKDNVDYAYYRASRSLYHYNRFGDAYHMTPDKAFARSQLSLKADPRIRHVWGRAFHNFILEALIAQPLTQKLIMNSTPIMIGRDIHKDLPFDIIRLLTEESWQCFGLDFSCFDSSINYYLVHEAFKLLRGFLDLTGDMHEVLFNYCYRLFSHTPLVMPDGKLYIVKTGIPSGSAFTQLIGSICNLFITYAAQNKFLSTTLPTYVLGDDSIFTIKATIPLTLDMLAEYYKRMGLKLNVEKSLVTTDYLKIYFLGHNFYGSRVTRDEFTSISLALFTEDATIRPQDSIIRVASLIYDCGFNNFGIYKIYQELLSAHDYINWSKEPARPVDIAPPFYKLFVLS